MKTKTTLAALLLLAVMVTTMGGMAVSWSGRMTFKYKMVMPKIYFRGSIWEFSMGRWRRLAYQHCSGQGH